MKKYILPYIVDWLFILQLGILMALLSFVIDYFIEQLGKGMYCTYIHVYMYLVCMCTGRKFSMEKLLANFCTIGRSMPLDTMPVVLVIAHIH